MLDLGAGPGRDAYMLAQLVGETRASGRRRYDGRALDVARRHVDWHAQKFGYAKPNTRSCTATSSLDELGLEPGSFDVIVSNCVINLSIDKPAVLKGAFDLLKPGGELYFSDVYADRPLGDRSGEGSGTLWRVPGRRALLERFSGAGQAGRVRRSAPRDEPTARRQQRGDPQETGRGAVLLRHLPSIQAQRLWSRRARTTDKP